MRKKGIFHTVWNAVCSRAREYFVKIHLLFHFYSSRFLFSNTPHTEMKDDEEEEDDKKTHRKPSIKRNIMKTNTKKKFAIFVVAFTAKR